MTTTGTGSAAERQAMLNVLIAWAEARGWPRVLPLMIVAAETGGTFDPWAVGDSGQSFGPLQVYTVVHGGDRVMWSGVDGTRRALALMEPRWRQAYQQRGPMPEDRELRAIWFAAFWPAAQGAVPAPVERSQTAIAAAEAALTARERERVSTMIEKPQMVWVGANPANFSAGRGGYAPEFVVLHIMEGSLAGADAWFNDARARASTHFGVGKDGSIHQYVQLTDTAYSHGIVEVTQQSAPTVIADNWGINPNQLGFGIEHEGKSGDLPTDAQLEASCRLTAWLFATQILPGGATNVAVDREHILGHYQITPRTRARCPGWPEDVYTRYVARVQALLAPAPPVDGSVTEIARLTAAVAERDARIRTLVDGLTVQASALRQTAAAAVIQAGNIDTLIQRGTAQ